MEAARGHPDQAARAFERCLEIAPRDSALRLLAMRALAAAGRSRDALALADEARAAGRSFRRMEVVAESIRARPH